ncbi:F0F1 ATP synthase subunit A [Exiguobacterium oxidotolerans]|uniref:ATP synthase subunit a n=1 Tax=Exiguobacterium oxidotolerans TaxID=223958 RepID=A0A653I8P5_9BACL|nr:F0F1 ATP synthase subunit A [Exiguobacterium oxidotolerans]VWX35547.1 ATP synthase (subunit a, component F0) [Exiguobacterium oxidotolerans]
MNHEMPLYEIPLWGDFVLYGSWTNLITVLIAAALVFLIAVAGTRRLMMKPTGAQNVMEMFLEFVRGIISSTMDWKTGGRFLTFGMTLFLFIIVSNLMGLPFNVVTGHYIWFNSPTADPYVTLALSSMVVVMSHYYGVKMRGFGSYAKTFMTPMFIITIIEEFANTLTLGLRLYGNIFAGEIMIGIILSIGIISGTNDFQFLGPVGVILSAIPMLIWQGFSLFIGAIQAYIFLILTMVYIGHKAAHDH